MVRKAGRPVHTGGSFRQGGQEGWTLVEMLIVIGLAIIMGCLGLEHWIVRKRSIEWAEKSFFRLNALIGTIFLTVYNIWHRRRRATSGPTGKSKFRNLLKYAYWRTTAPQRDWSIDPPFDFAGSDFSPMRDRALFEQSQGAIAAGQMFAWLSGVEEQYVKRGGTCWPLGPVGMPAGLEKTGED